MLKTAGFGCGYLGLKVEVKCKNCKSDNLILFCTLLTPKRSIVLRCLDCGELTAVSVKITSVIIK